MLIDQTYVRNNKWPITEVIAPMSRDLIKVGKYQHFEWIATRSTAAIIIICGCG